MTCTCRSFPDRMCACHLSGESHKECGCDCPRDWLTRGIGTCQQCGRYTTDRYCYATDGCKELGGADVL